MQLIHKIKEALISVLPVTLIVVLLNFTPLVNFEIKEIVVFVVSAFLLILGIGLFSLGIDYTTFSTFTITLVTVAVSSLAFIIEMLSLGTVFLPNKHSLSTSTK